MMKSKSNRSIQKILLSTYLNLMLVILLSVSFVFTAMEYVTMRKKPQKACSKSATPFPRMWKTSWSL